MLARIESWTNRIARVIQKQGARPKVVRFATFNASRNRDPPCARVDGPGQQPP
jgi:hypothetical protein